MDKRRKYPSELLKFVQSNAKGCPNKKLLAMVNEKFEFNMTLEKLKAFKKNHKISSGLSGRFEKGNVPANKGKKFPGQVNSGSFKKGCKPNNYRVIGSERIDAKDGYVLIKVTDKGRYQDRWKLKHRVIWEKARGKIPDGYALIFLDGNIYNFSLDNLELVSRAELVRINQLHLTSSDPEKTKTGVLIAKVLTKAHEKSK